MKKLILLIILTTVLTINLYAQGITIGSGTTLSLGSATLTLPNNWSNSGTFQAENGIIILNGSSGNQTIANSSGETFNELIVNKSIGDVLLLDSILVNGDLDLISGDLDLNNKKLKLGISATVNETAGNTIKGDGSAMCTKTLTAPSSVNILGAEITSSADLGITTVERGHTEQDVNGNPSILRYYDITPTNNTDLNATLKIYYDESELNGLDESKLDIYWYNPVSAKWESQGATCDQVNNYCSALIQHFSRWTLAEKTSSVDTLYMNVGWNLVSVPLVQTNDSASVIFPGKSGSVFEYNTATKQYVSTKTLACGKGYWVLYSAIDTVVITGSAPGPLTVTVAQAGWVLVGSHEESLPVLSLVYSNGAYKSGSIFRYDSSPGQRKYVTTTVIDPGVAVWVLVQGATSWPCTITIP
jgi:hypothetical protein